jgi:hypothetical protein
LASQFEAGKEYRTINVYRSAISGVLPKIDGVNVGQHPLVCQVKRVFSKRNHPYQDTLLPGMSLRYSLT